MRSQSPIRRPDQASRPGVIDLYLSEKDIERLLAGRELAVTTTIQGRWIKIAIQKEQPE